METASAVNQKVVLKNSSLNVLVTELLEKADIRIGGNRAWDMQINDAGVLERIFSQGSLGLGESYMDGHWDVQDLDAFFYRLLRAKLPHYVKPLNLIFLALRTKLLNRQNKKRAWQVGEAHYNLGNDFYAGMLDSRMTYTCGYWKDADNLEDAQTAKLDLICRKLDLKPGMRVLDIGCGWGSFMAYAAQHYGVECVGVSISEQQINWAKNRYADLPLTFHLHDYRELNEEFDAVVSIGMFEHVGRKNYSTFMEVVRRCLKDDGLFLLHTIGKNINHSTPDPWIDKYIFPNGELPSAQLITDALEGLFVVEDLHNFGADYDKTLMAWFENFDKNWQFLDDKFNACFYRMWKYYLLSCAGAFRARDLQLWQWVLSKQGVIGGYHRVS